MQNKAFRAVANRSLKGSLRIRRRHRTPLLFGAIGAVALAVSFPAILENSYRFSRLTTTIRQEAELTEQLKAKQDALTDRAQIADQRLKLGCNVIPNVMGRDGRIASLSEGMQIINPDNGAPFPSGAIACDIYGGTGVIGPNGVVSAIAVTTNYELVRNALALHGLKMQAGNPSVTAAQGSQTPAGVSAP